MKKEIFQELLTSVEQAVAIERGELKPSRIFTVNAQTDVARARALGIVPGKVCGASGHKPGDLAELGTGATRTQ